MNDRSHSKPEPLPAKSKWHYDSYYLSQLERLNLRQPTPQALKTEDNAQTSSDIQSPKPKAVATIRQASELKISKRDEVIKLIYELADSIGVTVTIIDEPNLVA